MDDEQVLIDQARRGDARGVVLLFEKYFDPLYRYTLMLVGDTNHAADIAERVFMRMIEAINSNRSDAERHLGSWLYGTAFGLIGDHLRRQLPSRVARAPSADIAERLLNPYNWAQDDDFRGYIAVLLRQLPSAQSQFLALKFGAGFTNSDIARLLGQPENTIPQLQLQATQGLYNLMRASAGNTRIRKANV